MNIRKTSAFVLCLMFGSAIASDASFERLASSKKLVCQFTAGSSVNWKSGRPALDRGGFKLNPVRIDDIDTKFSRAKITIGKETVEAKVLLAGGGLTFIEQTDNGTFVFTTVYASSVREDEYVAVMSRHTELTDSPAAGQFHGVCKPS